jgi:hypothetical protein
MIAKARELLAMAQGGIMQASDKPAPMRSLAPLSHRTLLAGLAQSDINSGQTALHDKDSECRQPRDRTRTKQSSMRGTKIS